MDGFSTGSSENRELVTSQIAVIATDRFGQPLNLGNSISRGTLCQRSPVCRCDVICPQFLAVLYLDSLHSAVNYVDLRACVGTDAPFAPRN
jgi:hypothetical protein